MGQLLLGDAGAVVPDADHRLLPLPGDRHIDPLAGAAVLGRIVQQITEHLAQPLRVSADGEHLLRAVLIGQFDALPAEKLPIGVHRVLQLRLQIQRLHRQGEPAVLNAGELQQLLHHVGQPPRLGDDDPHPLLHISRVPHLAVHDGFRPAIDRGQGSTQFMGH